MVLSIDRRQLLGLLPMNESRGAETHVTRLGQTRSSPADGVLWDIRHGYWLWLGGTWGSVCIYYFHPPSYTDS
jgi:hypothetical protein